MYQFTNISINTKYKMTKLNALNLNIQTQNVVIKSVM